jgi:hypothetical protein
MNLTVNLLLNWNNSKMLHYTKVYFKTHPLAVGN